MFNCTTTHIGKKKKTWDQKCLDQKLKCKLLGRAGQKFNMMIYRLSMKSISWKKIIWRFRDTQLGCLNWKITSTKTQTSLKIFPGIPEGIFENCSFGFIIKLYICTLPHSLMWSTSTALHNPWFHICEQIPWYIEIKSLFHFCWAILYHLDDSLRFWFLHVMSILHQSS